MTRFTLLVQLRGKRTMDALNASLETTFAGLPRDLAQTLTWDQGKEILPTRLSQKRQGSTFTFTNDLAPGNAAQTRTSAA